MMPTYQDRTLTCCVSITISIGTVWFLYHLFLMQGLQCYHIHSPAWLSRSGLCGYGLECYEVCECTDLLDVWYVQINEWNIPHLGALPKYHPFSLNHKNKPVNQPNRNGSNLDWKYTEWKKPILYVYSTSVACQTGKIQNTKNCKAQVSLTVAIVKGNRIDIHFIVIEK